MHLRQSSHGTLFSGNAKEYFSYMAKGYFKIECWGASGNGGGNGGYVSGFIYFKRETKLLIYPGELGYSNPSTPGFNGGGHSQNPGGGASDVRLIEGNWDNFSSLKSRIIVAGGGGGGDSDGSIFDAGGAAGGLIGFSSLYNKGFGGSQISGGKGNIDGSFGKGGGNGIIGNEGNGSGGGGYFGGGDGTVTNTYGGGGGSSFISGYDGCNAINDTLSTDEDNIVMTNQSIHYSGHRFFMMDIIDGNSLMPSPFGGTETGHSGFGVVRITPYKSSRETCHFILNNLKLYTSCFISFFFL